MGFSKRSIALWYRIVGMLLCAVLLGTGTVGVMATEVPAGENVEQTEDSSGETDTEDSSTDDDSDSDITEESSGEDSALPEEDNQQKDVHITAWTWVDEDEILMEYEGEWYLSLPGMDPQEMTEEEINETLLAMLPVEILATLSNGEEISIPIAWDLSSPQLVTPDTEDTESITTDMLYRLNAVLYGDYPLADDAESPYVLCAFSGVELYAATYPGSRTVLSEQELEKALETHQVKGLTPAGTTVNLFDYVASHDGAVGKDLTVKEALSTGHSAAKPSEWNKGINANRLLLFGDSMVGAGYWNTGAGAGRKWAKENTNMKGIVLPTLNNGYPKVDTSIATNAIANVGQYTENELPFLMVWAADANKKLDDYKQAPGLSQYVIDNNQGNTSLDYLFNPDLDLGTDVKRSYENVTGLFQMDEYGYYYYDARKNFAEFKKTSGTASQNGQASDGSFILYDGPAIWRTDGGWDGSGFNGDMSLGNFFPFNTGKQVFDSIDNNTGCLSSSEELNNTKWSNNSQSKGLTNSATGENVFINHHMGLTMTIDFTQTENGKLNMGSLGRQDMVFQFSGDDDVWIFIDDVLVLDLGGIHSELYGMINFATGEVVTGQSWRYGGLPSNPGQNTGDAKTSLYAMFVQALGQEKADAIHWTTNESGQKIFPTGTEHTLKMFYLERGNYDSSMQVRFNLQSSLYHSIKKVDQNGNPLAGAEFTLYAANTSNSASTDVADYTTVGDAIGTLTTGEDGKASFIRTDGSPLSFADQYHSNGISYYILKETKTAGGYRTLPKDIVLKFDPEASMLVVVNRYQTGAYASFFSNIRETGTLTYGQFVEESGVISSSQTELGSNSKQNGLIIAVPMLLEAGMSHDTVANDGKWMALYGSNTEGYGTVAPEQRTAEAWRKAVLKAALYQASDERWPGWYLTYNADTGKLEGLLEDLPGRSDRYLLNNENGDMKMVYGIIQPSALKKLGITGSSSAELYDALEAYVSGRVQAALEDPSNSGRSSEEVTEAVIEGIVQELDITGTDLATRDFSFLNTDQFQREFRSTIYIPNERRELRVQKVDEDGKGVNGATFTLTGPDGSSVTGTTATVDGQDGVLIFRPDAAETTPGYARVEWAAVGSRYTLQEASAPEDYKLNPTKIPVIVGTYSIYADAGEKDDGVTVMAGVGKLMQTMKKYAADDTVNITLRDITAIAQTQDSIESFSLNGWQDELLKGTSIPRSMNLHYGIHAVVDYGLHDEDGGKIIYPFFTTDVGMLRTRVVQNTAALQSNLYEGSNNSANWDNLSGMDLTSLFSLLNTVVVTDSKKTPDPTGRLRISKTIAGSGVTDADYSQYFTFTVGLKDANGDPLEGEYYYYGEERAGYIKNGETLSLRHDEALTIRGLPAGTQWTISEQRRSGWSVLPETGVISGEIVEGQMINASFTNYKGTIPLGDLRVSKKVAGNAGETNRVFHFKVTLSDSTITGQYGEMSFINGAASFTLKHNKDRTASGLPAGITYEVTEEEDNQDGYTTDKTGWQGSILADSMSEAIFTNTKTVPVTEFRFTKVKAEDPQVGLEGAVFNLYQLVCTGESHGHSVLVDTEHPGACWNLIDTQISAPEVIFTGLLPGEYRLVETKAPDGRVVPAGQWRVIISTSQEITITALGETLPPAFAVGEEGEWLLPNMQPLDVPTSGGGGTMRYILLGILLMDGGLLIGLRAWKHNDIYKARRMR